MVGEGEVAGVILKQTQIEFLLIRRKGIPGGHPFGTRRQFRVRRNDACLELSSVSLFANFLPTLIELPLELVAPFVRRVVRCVSSARSEVKEEWFLRCDRLGILNVVNRSVGHVGHQVITFLRRSRGLDGPCVFEQHRIVLVCFAANEAIEVFEAHAGWPAVKRTGYAAFPIGRVVIFAEPGRGVTVALQRSSD